MAGFHKAKDHKEKDNTVESSFWVSTVASIIVCMVCYYAWSWRWLISGTPILTASLLLGAYSGYRILPKIPLWTLIATLNLAYALCATSWLFYWVFFAACYPMIFISFLFQFDLVGRFVRRSIRSVLRELHDMALFHFVSDKVALFDVPALEIDRDVDGLMVIRGITISLSTLTVVAHGVEVGIKMTDDIEMAIQCDEVTIRLFRDIMISDCFADLKGGQLEMTFGKVAPNSHGGDDAALMVSDTPLLKAAAATGDMSRPDMIMMTDEMTNGKEPKDASVGESLNTVKTVTADEEGADSEYAKTLKWIVQSSLVTSCRKVIFKRVKERQGHEDGFEDLDENEIRAAICSELHDKPSIPHPPRRSIKVSTLQTLSPPAVRRFLHRLPLLLRLLLNPIAYFHPVKISSITAAASGKWVDSMLHEKVFQGYGENDKELRNLEQRIRSWLLEANFVVQLVDITGIAQVPVDPEYDISSFLKFADVLVFRTLAQTGSDLKEVVRLGGADCTIAVPSFLLPHHEHLLPAKPNEDDIRKQREKAAHAAGKPKTLQAQHDIKLTLEDETNVNISAHVRLPACFDQELLDFISALVKATKVVEMDKHPGAFEEKIHGIKEFGHALNQGMKHGLKRATVEAVVNDKWIAKLVGKVCKKLETALGDVGYSGDLPVKLDIYRAAAEPSSKLLP